VNKKRMPSRTRGSDLARYYFGDCLEYRDAARIDEVLDFYIARTRAGKRVHPAVTEFILRGLERIRKGKKPFPAKRGLKKPREGTAFNVAIYRWGEYFRQLKKLGSLRRADAVTYAAEELGLSDDTVRRAVVAVESWLRLQPLSLRGELEALALKVRRTKK
jgi:hypothetical protein